MPIEQAPANSLRDELSASFDEIEPPEQSEVAPTGVAPAPAADASTETAEQRAGRTANRLRAPDGRLLPGTKPATELVPPAQAPAAVRPARPSSWKKDFDSHWEQLDPTLAAYIHQRETEYARGVSTYKQEAESARTLNEAIAPFMSNLQKHGLQPTDWIRNLGHAHEVLALGAPQEKLHMTAQLIHSYGIDPQALFNLLSNPQAQQQIQQRQAPQQMPDMEKIVEAKLTERETRNEFNKFVADVPEKYPHYEAVKATMMGLLQSNLAQDYPSAYEAALRHPRHADLYEQAQAQRTAAEQATANATRQGVASRARSQAVSVKSSTPAGTMATVNGAKSLRDSISDSFESVTTSRV